MTPETKSLTYTFRQISVAIAAILIVLIILDLLMTRQILPYGTPSASIVEIVLFVLTVIIGYGIGTWAIVGYTGKISKELRVKSRLINAMYFTVLIIQLSLLGILLFVIYNNSVGCHDYFSLCTNNSSRISITSVYAISSIAATAIMGLISIKLFSWYRSSKKNFMLLFYGLAAASLAISIGGDAFDKILLIDVVQEKSPSGAIPQASFIYKTFEKYHGEIQYKIVNPFTTTLFVVPTQLLDLYNQVIYWTSLSPYILTWVGTAFLLHYYSKRTENKKIGTIKFWVILAIPLVLYLVGSGLIFSLPSDIPYRFYFRLVFRAGTIGSSVLFGLAFYIITRRLNSIKVKDYLIISAMGIVIIGIANEISALQQTYGAAAHSLVLLASYLFSIGLYCSALSVSQDSSLRKSIRNSTMEAAKLLDIIGTPQMKEEIERRALNAAKEQQSVLLEQTGIEPSLTERDMKQYLGTVLKEVKTLKNIDEILRKGKEILESSYEFFICSRVSGLRLAYNNYFSLYEKIIGKYKNGEHKGIKLVTAIVDKDATDLIKRFLDIGVQIRHVKNMPPIDFAVSDKEIVATTEKIEEPEELIKSLLVSNEQAYINHYAFIFNELWKDGIDARERILAIEQGKEPEFVEIINDPQRAKKVLIDLTKSIRKEALLILPDDKAMTRVYNLGVIDHLINASQNGATVKIICPLSKENSDIVKKMSDNASNIRILNSNTSSTGMLIVDNTKFFRAELKAPNADEFIEAIGFPIYSNSKPSVESFRSIFELLWNERALNEELKNTQTMQKEFIDMAAHELRTPIQPILSLSAVLQSKEEGNIKQYRELLDVINRSAKKLQKLTEDILDVSRIESQTLKLTKNQFNLKELILHTLTDYKAELKTGKDNKINLEFISNEKEDTFFVHADQGRITQVFSNLLSNAVKFTEEGSIVVKMKREKGNNTNSHEQVVVSIQDTGKGIDPAVRNKLFEKFETKSEKGIGLGLYISRRIIEAHAGRIWAENNADSKGATFSFSLPLSKL